GYSPTKTIRSRQGHKPNRRNRRYFRFTPSVLGRHPKSIRVGRLAGVVRRMMNLQPGENLGKYTTKQFLGSGVFGSVYLMRDNLLNRDVAVKFVENQNPT